MASTMFDLPDPLGPTTTVTPGGNSNRVLSAKLLKPLNSRALSIEGHRYDEKEKAVLGRLDLRQQRSLSCVYKTIGGVKRFVGGCYLIGLIQFKNWFTPLTGLMSSKSLATRCGLRRLRSSFGAALIASSAFSDPFSLA